MSATLTTATMLGMSKEMKVDHDWDSMIPMLHLVVPDAVNPDGPPANVLCGLAVPNELLPDVIRDMLDKATEHLGVAVTEAFLVTDVLAVPSGPDDVMPETFEEAVTREGAIGMLNVFHVWGDGGYECESAAYDFHLRVWVEAPEADMLTGELAAAMVEGITHGTRTAL